MADGEGGRGVKGSRIIDFRKGNAKKLDTSPLACVLCVSEKEFRILYFIEKQILS